MPPKHAMNLRLDANQKEALRATASLKSRSEADTISLLLAQGWRREMERSSSGVKRSYLDALSHDAIPRLFSEWLDGMATLSGVKGPLGNRYTLVEGDHGWLPEYVGKGPQTIGAAVSDLAAADPEKRLAAVNFLAHELVDADPEKPTGFLGLLITAASGGIAAREGVQDLIASGAVKPAHKGG